MIAVDVYQYGCAARKDRGASVCSGTLAPRRATDARLLSAVRDELESGAAMAQVREEAIRLTDSNGDVERARATRKAALQREIERLADAVAQLGLSNALRARLTAAEEQLDELQGAITRAPPTADEIVTRYRANLLRLTEALRSDVDRARVALREMLGEIRIEQRDDGTYAKLEMEPATLLLAAGSQLGLVAGAGFEPATFGL
jgi:site-specific DNA recombinase